MIPARYYAGLLALVMTFLAGLGLGWRLDHPQGQPNPSRHLQERRLEGGGLALEQNPTRAPPLVHHPKEWTVEKVATVQVEPTKPGPVNLTISEVKTPEGERIIVESPDGKIIGGAAWNVGPVPSYRWSLQAVRIWTREPNRAEYGGALSYERGRFVTSITLAQHTAMLGVGIRW